jgi:hypothetical protein
VGADGLAELLLEDLDFESVEVGQFKSLLLLLDALSEASGVVSFAKLEVDDFLPFELTSERSASRPSQPGGCGSG